MKDIPADALAAQITASIREAIAAAMPAGCTLTEIHTRLVTHSLPVNRETVVFWMRKEQDAHRITLCAQRRRWVLGPNGTILVWDKPPLAQPYEEWASYQADGAPPGTYAPNMTDERKLRWKAKMHGQRSPGLGELEVSIRKSASGGGVQVKIVVCHSGEVLMSMNGTAMLSPIEFAQLPLAVDEAREAMRLYAQHHGKDADEAQESA